MAIATKPKPKATAHHKRRHGSHQKRSNHFVKTYWPYLPLLFIVGVGLFFNAALGSPKGILGYATNTTANGLLASTNIQRQDNKLANLTLNPELSRAAQAKAEDMVHRNYWSHTTPDGKEPWIFINQTGYQYQAAGENLAYGFNDSTSTVTGWMNSPGHRANILNNNYREVGFGIVNSQNYQSDGNQTIVVAMYAQPAQSVNVSATVPSQQPSSQPGGNNQPIAVNTNNQSGKLRVSAIVPGETKVARVQMAASGGAPWSLYAISILGGALLFLFLIRHSLAWHRVVVRGEKFILKHKVLDVFIVSGIMVGFILTRTAGFIQ